MSNPRRHSCFYFAPIDGARRAEDAPEGRKRDGKFFELKYAISESINIPVPFPAIVQGTMRNHLLDEAADAFDRDDVHLAEELYLKCLAEDPRNAEALRELALIVYGFKSDGLKAKELVEISLSLENSPKAHFILGIILNDLGIHPQADEELKKAIQATGGLAVFHSMYGDILVTRERFEEAKGHFIAALSDEPDYEPAQKSYAKLLAKEKE